VGNSGAEHCQDAGFLGETKGSKLQKILQAIEIGIDIGAYIVVTVDYSFRSFV
jgi:hypothetical protein